jgi:N6-L-threonylcarbamoyladenine synthase
MLKKNKFYEKIIIGVETSCDDTCVGVLKINQLNKVEILSNIKVNQNILHEKYGGIVPEVAARSHIMKLPFVFEEALKIANISLKDINLIAYTKTPGLLGSLLIGENFVKGISCQYNIPIKSVNHLQAHNLVGLINNPIKEPFLGLVISGGHSELWYFKDPNDYNNYEILEKTIDDAIGELFDKVGRAMGLDFPAGPILEKLSKETNEDLNISLPKAFSFSGLKTKFIKLIEQGIDKPIIANSLQITVAKMLVNIINKHIKNLNLENIPILIGGGVASNLYIRHQLEKNFTNIYFPPIELCTDNGVMIGWCGYLNN